MVIAVAAAFWVVWLWVSECPIVVVVVVVVVVAARIISSDARK